MAASLKGNAVTNRPFEILNLRAGYGTSATSKAVKQLEKNTSTTLDTNDPIISVSITDKTPQRAQVLASGYLSALKEVTKSLSISEQSQP